MTVRKRGVGPLLWRKYGESGRRLRHKPTQGIVKTPNRIKENDTALSTNPTDPDRIFWR